MTPEHVIAHALRYDHKPGSNARQIIDALENAGYKITPASLPTVNLPEIGRMYGTPTGGPTTITGSFKTGGIVPRDGIAQIHTGETVTANTDATK